MSALPPWLAVLVGVLVLAGAGLTCIGAFGLLRLRNFYQRVHAPTLGSTLGTFFVALACALGFPAMGGSAVPAVLLISVFLVLAAPVTLMMLVRAALYRNRLEDGQALPTARGDDQKPMP